MPISSKTGLLPYAKSSYQDHPKMVTTVLFPNLASPAPFTLRPFAGLYNPFPYGCSVLCNHPADYEAKDVVKKAKDAWILEGRVVTSTDPHPLPTHLPNNLGLVPEELFRRYTDTDSRPVTPAPTIASAITKSSIRRCVTPEPTVALPAREKTLLVLDLRRSHSQDTLSWQGGDISVGAVPVTVLQPPTPTLSRTPSSTGDSTSKRRKSSKAKTPIPSLRTQSEEVEENRKSTQEQTIETLPIPEPSEGLTTDRSGSIDSAIIKRRGKRIKGKKSKRTNRSGEKEFQGILEPGETQVSALGDESRTGSNRPSLTNVTPDLKEVTIEEDDEKVSFLDVNTLKLFQRQLDQETVDAEFDFKRKIILSEALRMCPVKCRPQGEELKVFKKELQVPLQASEKWLRVPRIFSRKSARFELPMDSTILNDITPMEYARKYVFPSKERLVLYNQIFNLHKEEFDEDEQPTDRILLGKNIAPGLGDVMGRKLTTSQEIEVQELFGWNENENFDFRTFSGIAAIYERIFSPQFVPNWPSHEADPCHEIEFADFQTLDKKLIYLQPNKKIIFILKSIRDF